MSMRTLLQGKSKSFRNHKEAKRRFASEAKRSKIRERNTKVIVNLPIPPELLPEWVQQRREFVKKFIELAKKTR